MVGWDFKNLAHSRYSVRRVKRVGPCKADASQKPVPPELAEALLTWRRQSASLIAIVIGGYSFAHGDPGAKKTLGGVAAGTGIAVLAVNVLSWLWGA